MAGIQPLTRCGSLWPDPREFRFPKPQYMRRQAGDFADFTDSEIKFVWYIFMGRF
jgi:hypothetical protein